MSFLRVRGRWRGAVSGTAPPFPPVAHPAARRLFFVCICTAWAGQSICPARIAGMQPVLHATHAIQQPMHRHRQRPHARPAPHAQPAPPPPRCGARVASRPSLFRLCVCMCEMLNCHTSGGAASLTEASHGEAQPLTRRGSACVCKQKNPYSKQKTVCATHPVAPGSLSHSKVQWPSQLRGFKRATRCTACMRPVYWGTTSGRQRGHACAHGGRLSMGGGAAATLGCAASLVLGLITPVTSWAAAASAAFCAAQQSERTASRAHPVRCPHCAANLLWTALDGFGRLDFSATVAATLMVRKPCRCAQHKHTSETRAFYCAPACNPGADRGAR